MKIANALILAIKGDASHWKKTTDDVKKSSRQLGKEIKDGFLKVFAVVGAAAVALVPAILEAANFEEGVKRLGAVAGTTKEELSALEEQALQLGRTTQKSAQQIIAAHLQLARAGFKTLDILNITPAAIDASVISGEDLASVTSKIATGVKAFGIASKNTSFFIDRLTHASNNANQSFGESASAFAYGASGLRRFNATAGEGFALIGGLADVGRIGQEAGTAINGLVNSLIKNEDKLKAVGIQVTDAAGNYRSIIGIIKQFEQATLGLSESQAAAVVQTLQETRSIRTLSELLIKGSANLREFAQANDASNGISKKTVDQINEGLNPALLELRSAWEGLQIQIGKHVNPSVEKLADKLAILINKITDFLGPTEQAANFLTLFGLGLAGVLSYIIVLQGKILIFIGSLDKLAKNFKSLSVTLKVGGFLIKGLGRISGAFIALSAALEGVGFLLRASGIEFNGLSDIVKHSDDILRDFLNLLKYPISGFIRFIGWLAKMASAFLKLQLRAAAAWRAVNGNNISSSAPSYGAASNNNTINSTIPPPAQLQNPNWVGGNNAINSLPGWGGKPGYETNQTKQTEVKMFLDSKEIGSAFINYANENRTNFVAQ